jgi:hypothetical protein
MEEAGSGHEDSSHNILTLDALQVLSRSQVTLGCQCPCRYGRYVKSTYIHTELHRWNTPAWNGALPPVFPARSCVQAVLQQWQVYCLA